MKSTTLQIRPNSGLGTIAPEIYGQFTEHLGRCIYDGLYVGEDSEIPNIHGIRSDVIDALRELHIPVLRWPGGCFADEYHWKDGIGPKDQRRRMINSNWGGTVEDNSFGTHEFMEFCEQIGCEPYIAVNMGSGTVEEAAQWVEYLTAEPGSTLADLRAANGRKEPWHVKYLGIGNESWGCGGSMTADFYANEYKRYQQFCREYSGNTLYKIACGPNADDYNWTRELMSRINHWHAKGISLHYYTVPGDWEHKGSATDFSSEEYYTTIAKTLEIENIIRGHLAIMDELDPAHDIDLIIDEWGTWFDVEPGTNPGFLYQQNTMRDALVAALNLNIFNKHCDRISMANIAQTVNVLQSMLLTEGTHLVKTPTYHVFSMYRAHQGARLLETSMDPLTLTQNGQTLPMVSQSVSILDGVVTLTLANCSLTEDAGVDVSLADGSAFAGTAQIELLHQDVHAHNTFEDPEQVCIRQQTEDWSGLTRTTVHIPPCSVISIHCPVTLPEDN